jgi:hypothetical protein
MAALGNIGPVCASILKDPLDDTPRASASRKIEKDGGVATGESHLHRSPIVPVDDPAIAFQKIRDLLTPHSSVRLNPTGAPEVSIEMYHRQTGDLAKPS